MVLGVKCESRKTSSQDIVIMCRKMVAPCVCGGALGVLTGWSAGSTSVAKPVTGSAAQNPSSEFRSPESKAQKECHSQHPRSQGFGAETECWCWDGSYLPDGWCVEKPLGSSQLNPLPGEMV